MGVTIESANFKFQRPMEVMHRFHRDLIKAAIKYLRSDLVEVYNHENRLVRVKSLDRENKAFAQDNIDAMVAVLSDCTADGKIDYTFFDEEEDEGFLRRELPSYCLAGLFTLVTHDYNNRFFTVGQAIDISWTYFTLEPFFEHYTQSWDVFTKIRTLCADCIHKDECRPLWTYTSPDYQE